MKLRVEDLGEPMLEFRNGTEGKDPKRLLTEAGPFGAGVDGKIRSIRLGIVACESEVPLIEGWIARLSTLLVENETNVQRFRNFPGSAKAFHADFEAPRRFVRVLSQLKFDMALQQTSPRNFEALLEVYGDAINGLFGDDRPDVVLVAFPEAVASLRVSNPRLTAVEQQVLSRAQEEQNDAQLSLFDPSPEEQKAAAELLPQAEELLYRNFHRALKAKCMLVHNAVPVQVIRRHTYVDAEAKQSAATRAWNAGLALYYKAGNIPWRPKELPSGTCFIGVSFHHLKRRSGDLVYASVAQAFSSDLEPFALKGASIPREQTRNKQPYLNEEQAGRLVQDVVRHYEAQTGARPHRVVVHKTSRYEPEEDAGFGGGLLDVVPACDLIWMVPTGFRLLRRGMREPLRGTLCTLGGDDHFLFTMGYVPWWSEYPGPHIPSPLQIGSSRQTDISQRAREILALTKMNWNSADGIGRHPISITFSRRVGITMTEMDEEDSPNPRYRFYM